MNLNKKNIYIPTDMHSDGIRFSEEQKRQLRKEREKRYCYYSGIPSIYSYQ